jgi:thiol:disulfide interchange protein DsbD
MNTLNLIRRQAWRLLCTAALLGTLSAGALAASPPTSNEPIFLEPEQAFEATAKAQDAHTVVVHLTAAEGYYLYKDKIKVSADQGAVLGEIKHPPAQRKIDPTYGETEIYKGAVDLPITVSQATTPFNVTIKAQGCADAGLCYAPFKRTVNITMPGGGTLSATAAPADESSQIGAMLTGSSVPLIVASFFGFGLLLAFTPCVFPMIPILSGIIVGHGANISKRRALMLSLAYVMGMAITYTLAGVAAGMSGTLLSAALQNVWVLGSFSLVFVVLSLSMFGFYDLQLPASVQSRLSDSANRQGGSMAGVALMGALSALIVGPCVAAPLAGALLYIAKTGDALLGGIALFAMALGMGAPLVAVGVAARTALPRAGAWMEGVKKAFGVMLLGVAIWLVSPVAPAMLVMCAWAALLIFSAIYLHAFDSLPAEAPGARRFWKGVGVMAALAGAAMFIGALGGSRDPLQPLAALRGGEAMAASNVVATPFTKVRTLAELDAQLARSDRPVMLDFYADWCVSCKEMEHLTFTDPKVREQFGRMHLIQVDVTQNSDDDKALLKRFGLFGPPGMVFFAPGSSTETRRVVGFKAAPEFAQVVDTVLAQR